MLVKNKLAHAEKQGVEGITRTMDFTLAKLTEELGELAVEVQVTQGRLPQDKGGSDGVIGEVADIINVALDLAYLYMNRDGNRVTPGEVEKLLSYVSSAKLLRWEEKQKKIEEMQISSR